MIYVVFDKGGKVYVLVLCTSNGTDRKKSKQIIYKDGLDWGSGRHEQSAVAGMKKSSRDMADQSWLL